MRYQNSLTLAILIFISVASQDIVKATNAHDNILEAINEDQIDTEALYDNGLKGYSNRLYHLEKSGVLKNYKDSPEIKDTETVSSVADEIPGQIHNDMAYDNTENAYDNTNTKHEVINQQAIMFLNEKPLYGKCFQYSLGNPDDNNYKMIIGNFCRSSNTDNNDDIRNYSLKNIIDVSKNSEEIDYNGGIHFCIEQKKNLIYLGNLSTAGAEPFIPGKFILNMLKTFADSWSTTEKPYFVELLDASNLRQLAIVTTGQTYYEFNGFEIIPDQFGPGPISDSDQRDFDKIKHIKVNWKNIYDEMMEIFFRNEFILKYHQNSCLEKMKEEFSAQFSKFAKEEKELLLFEYWKIAQQTMKAYSLYDFPDALFQQIYKHLENNTHIKIINSMLSKKLSECSMRYVGKTNLF